MTLRRIDARFLLPFPPRTATVLGGAEDWVEPLARVGIDGTASGGRTDILIAGAASAGRALASPARAVVVEGCRATASGWAARAFLPLPSLTDPALIVPLDRPRVLGYVMRTWAYPDSRVKLVRNRLAAALAGPAAALTRRPTLTVALRSGEAQPFLVAGGAEIGVPADADWFLVCGQGDELSRGAFVLFPAGAREPEWVLKFSRAPGYPDPFDQDQRGLRFVEGAGGAAAAHAPRLLGRAVVEGHDISLETAALGGRLSAVLRSAISQRRKERAVDAIAAWVLEIGRETATRTGSGAAELERLARDVIPAWGSRGVQLSLLRGLENVPGVLQHNDLGSWNVVVGDDHRLFTALDWESARLPGLPRWDLLYFLADALTLLDGTASEPDGFARLFRGEAPSSARLFAWTRRAVDSLAIPTDAVGAIATTCWLHHGLSRVARKTALGRHTGQAAAMGWRADTYAEAWLTDPALGPGWRVWSSTA